MIIGADTGFFMQYALGQQRATQIWQETRHGDHRLVISVLSIAEYLAYHITRGTLGKAEEAVRELASMPNIDLVPVSLDLAARSARYRIGLQIATVDALILTTFLESHCDIVLTTDSDIVKAQSQNLISVELLA